MSRKTTLSRSKSSKKSARNIILGTFLSAASVFSLPAFAADVVIGYQSMLNPWKSAIANEAALEKATGLDIEFRQFDSGAKVISALASGSVDIASAGSSPIAAGISRGLPIDLFWILENINDAEALVVREGSGINAPQDLKGKKIGVPFVSTTHFHTLFALEQFGISPDDVELLNLQPNAIAAAWERGDIDAAFVWDPALGRIKESGQVLITSGDLSNWGKATFDGLVVTKAFANEHPEFLARLVSHIASLDAQYRRQAAALTPSSPLVKDIASVVGVEPEAVLPVLALYDFPAPEAQLSEQWLGGGAAKALKFTSEFLAGQGKIPKALNDYSGHVRTDIVESAREL
jgi:taurine transport system substrate-binding protein